MSGWLRALVTLCVIAVSHNEDRRMYVSSASIMLAEQRITKWPQMTYLC